MENVNELTKDQIINEVKRTGILRPQHFSKAAVDFIYSFYDYDYETIDSDGFLYEPHMIAFLKLELETGDDYPQEDSEIINLVYESPIETLKVSGGYVELFADRSLLYHRVNTFPPISNNAYPWFVNEYIEMNRDIVTAAHDRQYSDPDNLTEEDRNEIYLASLSPLRFRYKSDLRTVYSIDEHYQGRPWLRTLTFKRPKPASQKFLRTSIGKLEIKYFSEQGAKIVEHVGFAHQYTDLNEFLKIQSFLHLLERKFLTLLQEPEYAEKPEVLKEDLLKIQAFKDASEALDQIVFPSAEILIFSDRSVLFAPESEEAESYPNIYQFIMTRLEYLQNLYFIYDREDWEPDPNSVSSQLGKYGVEFTFAGGRVITKFTRKFKDKIFRSANFRLV